jgi:hypothetical protein
VRPEPVPDSIAVLTIPSKSTGVPCFYLLDRRGRLFVGMRVEHRRHFSSAAETLAPSNPRRDLTSPLGNHNLKSPLSAGGAIEPSGRAFEQVESGAQPLAVVEGGWVVMAGGTKSFSYRSNCREVGAGQQDGGIATLAERPIT